MPTSCSPLASSRLALAALVALALVACGANVAAPSSTTSKGTTTTTGAGGGSSSSCAAPRVDRAESGACATAGSYGVDEANPMCCRPCAADEVASTELGTVPVCKRVDSADGGGTGGAGSCALGDPAWKACGTADECEPVGLHCYCGAQPVVGITKALSAKAAQCDSATPCELGCMSGPGHVAEDGHDDVDGGAIAVRCNGGLCTTVIE
jgi:hypothetical protein